MSLSSGFNRSPKTASAVGDGMGTGAFGFGEEDRTRRTGGERIG